MRIIKFGKPDCAPCQNVDKFLKDSGVDFTSINPFDTDDFESVITHNVKTVPITVLVDKDGTQMARKAGFNEKALEKLVNMYKSNNTQQ